MFTVDASKLLVGFLTLYAISSAIYDLNKTVILATYDLLNTALYGEVAEEEEEEEEEALCAKCAEKDAGKTD